MKYIIRSIKYFFYVCIIVTLVMTVLVLCNVVSADVNLLFKRGWTSVLEILLMFAGVSLIYPRFGFTKRLATVLGETEPLRKEVLEYMESRLYVLEKEEDGLMCFRCRSVLNRLTRMLEDRITIERGLGGFYVEGPTKDVTRIVTGLEYKFRNPDEAEN